MTLPWFARLYALVIRWRDWAHTKVDPYKIMIRARIADLRAKVRERLSSGSPGIVNRLAALRARVHDRRGIL